MRFAFLVVATAVLVAVASSCNEGSDCGGGEFDILTPVGCVQSATVDCFLEEGGGAPNPFVDVAKCDGQSGFLQAPAITLNYPQTRNFEPTTCHVGITCADGTFEAYDIDWACGSPIALSPQIGFRGSGLTACLHASEDGGLDAAPDVDVTDAPRDSRSSDAAEDASADASDDPIESD